MAIDREEICRRPVSDYNVEHLPNGLVPARSPIEGKTVCIEPLNPALHGAELYQASHDSSEARQIWQFLPWGPWQDQAEFGSWLHGMASSLEFVWYAFRPKQDGRAQGMACYLDIAPSDGVIEIGGIWFSPDMQQTRAATEALYLMISYAMTDLGYRRLQWRCNALNEKSRATARRLGFQFEGIFYNHMIVRGHNRDTAWYSLTDRDWPQVQTIFQEWLDDLNFDANDVARQSLSDLMRGRKDIDR
jgi:RimJ/RimL family protein N-acetyltransferase